MDIFELMHDEFDVHRWKYEPINYTIGRLRSAIKYGYGQERQLELLEKISNEVIDKGII